VTDFINNRLLLEKEIICCSIIESTSVFLKCRSVEEKAAVGMELLLRSAEMPASLLKDEPETAGDLVLAKSCTWLFLLLFLDGVEGAIQSNPELQ